MNEVRDVDIAVDGTTIRGDLVVPDSASAVVVFAHGSGSGRHSPRNRLVATRLQQAGFATLLLDLLTDDEERIDVVTARLRFDIGLLAERLEHTIDGLDRWHEPRFAGVGLFGASTGAAAALVAAARRNRRVGAVVSRGGRPDLAGDALAVVTAPTLLIVGGRDDVVLELNLQAESQLGGEHRLVVVPGATHLFEEPGALDQVATLAVQWFTRTIGDQRSGVVT